MRLNRAVLSAALCLLLSSLPFSIASSNLPEINRYWTDAAEIFNNLDDYQALWVKLHNCVWSECAVDDNDDDGEGRDGDENWYMGRVQHFCANAAYSLYGIPKNWMSVPLMGCSRGHYIDTFFTYNSSDVFLRALGDKTNELFDDDNVEWGRGNAACHSEGDGTSQTLGCTSNGRYGMAAFNDEYCDGNYFSEIIDPMTAYNSKIRTHCHLVYGRNGWISGNSYLIQELLQNSWSCDIDMYPNGCPDPYGKKQIRANALHAASKGRNPSIAYNNAKFKRPLRITAWVFFVTGIFFFLFSYRLTNKDRIKKRGGGLRGMILVAREDYENYKKRRESERREHLQAEYDEDNKVAKGWRRRRRKSKAREGETEEERRERKAARKKKKKSRRGSKKDRDGEEDGHDKYEEDWEGLPDVA